MYKRYLFLLATFLISCGNDNSKNAISPEPQQSENSTSLNFNSYAGLMAEEPCDSKLYGFTAHVNENNTDYVCFYDESLQMWSWNALNNPSSSSNNSSSSLSENSFISSSSLLQNQLSSSNEEINSVTEIAGTSCLLDNYQEPGMMEYLSQGLVVPIEGTNTSLKCLKNGTGNWIWTIVENETYVESTQSSSSFTYGSFTDPRDGQTYKTVGIRKNVGTIEEIEEIWFAEDLKYQCSTNPCVYTWQTAQKKSCVSGGLCSFPDSQEQGLCPDGWFIWDIGYDLWTVEALINESIHQDGAQYWRGTWRVESASLPWNAWEFVAAYYVGIGGKYGECERAMCHGGESIIQENNRFNDKFRVRCMKYDGKASSNTSKVDICNTDYPGEWISFDDCKEIHANPNLREYHCGCKT